MASVDYTVEARIAYLSWLADEDAEAEMWVRTLRDYAGGKHPTYLTDRQKEFIGLHAKDASHLYAHNLCALVLDTVVERMRVTGFMPMEEGGAGDKLAEWAMALWDANRMDAKQDEAHEAAARDGESFIIAEWDAEEGRPAWAINQLYDGTQGVKVHRDPVTNEVLFASKRWQPYDPSKRDEKAQFTRLTLYFPNRIERYISAKPGEGIKLVVRDTVITEVNWKEYRGETGQEPWPIWWTEDGTPTGKPLGLAVVTIDNPGGSDIQHVLSEQDALNKTDLDLIAAADVAGFRILWASGVKSKLGADGTEDAIEINPAKLIKLADPAAQMSAIQPADLSQLQNTAAYWIESIAGQSRTPHYLLRASGADQPSGESLKHQEVGLLAKCKRKQRVWGNAYEDLIALSAKLNNLYRPDERIELARLQTQWDSVETRDEKAELETATLAQGVGLPQEMIWSEYLHMDQEEVDRAKELQAEQREAEGDLATVLVNGFNRGMGNEG